MPDARIKWVGSGGYSQQVSASGNYQVAALTIPAQTGLSSSAILVVAGADGGPGGRPTFAFTDNNGNATTLGAGTYIPMPESPNGGFRVVIQPSLDIGLEAGGTIYIAWSAVVPGFPFGSTDQVNGTVAAIIVDGRPPADTLQTWTNSGNTSTPTVAADDPGVLFQFATAGNFGGEFPITDTGGASWTEQTSYHQLPTFGVAGTSVVLSTYLAASGVAYTPPSWSSNPADPEFYAEYAATLRLSRSLSPRSFAQVIG